MAKQAVAYLIMGSLAATLVQCSSDRPKEPATATAPVPEPMPAEQMAPAAGTVPPAPMAETPSPSAEQTTPAAAPQRQALNDEQIAAMTDTADNVEIEQAKIAQKNAKNPKVKKFAAMMVKDHTQAKQKQQKLVAKLAITPASSPMSTELETSSQQKLEELKALKGAEFDQVYIDAQVEAHQKLLDALDNQLIPEAKNAELKTLLGELRSKVAEHLAEAKEIQQALIASAAASPSQPKKQEGSGSKASPEPHQGHKH